MDLASCYKIGYVLKPHGLKGEVTIAIDDDAPEDISALESVFLEKDNILVPYFIESISVRGAKGYLKLEDVDTPEAATTVSKRAMYIPKTSRPKSGRGEFYDDEVTGFTVVEEGATLGTIVDVMNAGPNRLLVLDHQGKEVLIPVNSPFVLSVNKSKKTITVSLPEGFLDI